MTGALLLCAVALLLGLAAAAQLLAERRRLPGRQAPGPMVTPASLGLPMPGGASTTIVAIDTRLGLSARIARAGLAGRISVTSLLAAKSGSAIAGALWALVSAPATPSRDRTRSTRSNISR